VKEAGSPKLLFENMDLTPIHPILWTDLHTEGPRRPGEYNPEWDLRDLMLRQIEQIFNGTERRETFRETSPRSTKTQLLN
jgi:hypothetical protein